MIRRLVFTTCLLAGVAAAPAHAQGYRLGPATFGSLGGVGAGGAYVLGETVGQPVTGARGLAIAPVTEEGAGFWRWGRVLTLDVAPAIDAAPIAWAFEPAAPNPFRSSTSLRYAIPGSAGDVAVRLRIFDLSGRLVRTLESGTRGPGVHVLTWNGRDDAGRALGAGIYFGRVTAGPYAATRRLVLTP